MSEELKKEGLNYTFSIHGAVVFPDGLTQNQFHELKQNLLKSGLVLLDQSTSSLIDKIINTIVQVIHYSEEVPRVNFADVFNENLIAGNKSLLKIFSDVKGISVVQFIIIQKIERIKELLLYDDLTLSEISKKLFYKNNDYLLAQFKKYTGLSPSYFRKIKMQRI